MADDHHPLSHYILGGLLVLGTFAALAVAPGLAQLVPYLSIKKRITKKDKMSLYSAFSYLRKRGYVRCDYRGNQLYISLTKQGKKLAGKYQVDDLSLARSRKWDGLWRILIFDVKKKDRLKREALRGKIKELGLYQLQKSVWLYPYSFDQEMRLLRSSFGFTPQEMKMITANGVEDDEKIREHFKLSN